MIALFAQVIVDIAHTEVDRFFTYMVPEGLNAQIGMFVQVPFGRGNKKTEAFIVGLSAENENIHFEVKEIIKALAPYPVFTEEQLRLCSWMKTSYHCRLVDALRLLIPAELRGGRIREKVEKRFEVSPDIDETTIVSLLYKKDGVTPKSDIQCRLFTHIRQAQSPLRIQEISAYYKNASPALKALVQKGLLKESGTVTFRRPDTGGYGVRQNHELTQEQADAYASIKASMDAGDNKTFLMHGVTGSGKTEIYMRLIDDCVIKGVSAILLVPEIALTPQTMGLFRARFQDRVAVLHSKLSAGERFDEWRRIRFDIACVAVGARSAVFAPFENIGLIVIDEEHEQTYQSESTPRYHAAEVAKQRCKAHGATLLLASATPSLQSYFRAKQGIYELITLKSRVQNRPMPAIEVVDMRTEFMNGNNGIFSTALYLALQECLHAKKQAILFLNRRGYSTFVSCRGCGYVFTCPNCDVSMTYHKTEEAVKCHYCGESRHLPEKCPQCAKPYVKFFGVGTQQVEEQLQELFPHVKAMRMDLDTTRTKDAHEQMFSAFARGEAQVLIGTQMVAKGLDFKDVTLVGVVAADSSLHLPDYRSGEKTFQLLMQVAGRAGRDKDPGTVIVQTYTPQHPSIAFAAQHDYKGFFRYELMQRRAALFPPFTLFIRALLCGSEELPLLQECSRLKTAFDEHIKKELGTEFMGDLLYSCASPAPVKKRQGIYRHQVLIKLLRTKRTAGIIRSIYRYLDESPSSFAVMLEINPGELF